MFNKLFIDVQCTVCLYVDDLKITCVDPDIISNVVDKLEELFPGLKPNSSTSHSYLGMNFDYEKPGEFRITMKGYIDDVLSQCPEIVSSVCTPALSNLFELVDSPLLDDARRERFHSLVAKLLYLAKRVRPDILTAISFLATRVQAPTENDWKRLIRVLRYLYGSRDLGIVLRPGDGPYRVIGSADAAFGVHQDGKSHSGLVIALGEGPVFVRSAKQKIVTKSSTEAELVSLSDGCSQVIWSRDFVLGQGYGIGPATIYQDNMSTIAMVENGRPTSDRTRHINVRYFFVSDRVSSGEVNIVHLPSQEMSSDFLSKPKVGQEFLYLRAKLLNWYY